MSPSTCKIVLLVSESLPGVAEWLGPSSIMAVAFIGKVSDALSSDFPLKDFIENQIREQRILYSARLLEPAQKNETDRRTASVQVLNELGKKLPKDAQILAALAGAVDSEAARKGEGQIFPFPDLRIQDKKLISIPAGIESAELKAARAVSAWWSQKQLEELRFDSPMVDFSVDNPLQLKDLLTRYDLNHMIDWKHAATFPLRAEVDRKKKLLLHVCCGPDAAGVVNQLKEEFDLLCFWYDPNIQPEEEHEKRLDAFKEVARIENVDYVVGEYDVQNFYQRIKGMEHTAEQGAKCSQCYDLRLERAALEAQNQNCDLYATTLAISPHKVQEKLKNFGELNHKKYGVPYLARNFMKHDGFKDSVDFTREHNIYRQDYCGCYFSLYEGGSQAQELAKSLQLTKENLRPGFKNPFIDPVTETEN